MANDGSKSPMHLTCAFDKSQQYLVFDFDSENRGPYWYQDRDRVIQHIFGRMYYSEYRNNLYPFFPAYLRFYKATKVEHGEKIEFKNEYNEVSVNIPPEKIKQSLLKSLKKNLQANANKIRQSLIEDIIVTENSKSDLIETTVINNASDDDTLHSISAIEQLLSDFNSQLETLLEKSNVKVDVKKKIRTTKHIPVTSPQSTYHFIVDDIPVTITCDKTVSQVMALLQPYLDYHAETQRLIKEWRNIGVPPELRTYEYKGTVEEVYEHQWKQWAIGCRLKSFANLSQMGTGKTLVQIMIIDTLLQNGTLSKGRILFIAPASTLENLRKEFKRHAPHLTTTILNGSSYERMNTLMDVKNWPDVFLTNYETMNMRIKLQKDGNVLELPMSEIFKCVQWQYIVLDEVHKIKNPEAQRTKNTIEAFKNVDYKAIMSGTISANKPHDMHTPYIFLNNARNFNSILEHRNGDPLTYGELNGQFLSAYFNKDGWNWIPKRGTIEELKERMEEISVRFEKKECMNLPEKVYETRFVDLSPQQLKLYQELERALKADLDKIIGKGGKITILSVLAMNMKLAEAANGWIYDTYGRVVTLPENPKLDAVIDILDDIDDGMTKCIIWSQFQNDMRMLKDAIAKEYGPQSVAIVDGNVNFQKRFAIQEAFNDINNPLRFVVCNVLAAGTGIDLIGASYEIYFSNPFRKVERSQSEDRAHRFGMRSSLTIIDVIARNTVDEVVISALRSWKSMSAALTENLGFDPSVILANVDEDNEEPAIVEFQKQFANDCLLAALAMASGHKLQDIHDEVCELTGRTQYVPDGTCSQAVYQLMVKYINKRVADEWKNERVKRQQLREDIEKYRAYMNNLQLVELPTAGKGFITLHNTLADHIVYYQDGMVYDSAMEHEMPVGKWRAKIYDGGSKVAAVIEI